MKNFDDHCTKMLEILKGYATEQGIAGQMSGLLIVQEVGPAEPDQGKLRMTLMGESPEQALLTVTQAAAVVTQQLQGTTERPTA